jgi:laminin alpha 1/2
VDGFKEIPIEKMLARANYLYNRSGKFSNNAEKGVRDVEKMSSEADTILMELRDVEGMMRKTIIELKNYGSHDSHLKLPHAIRDANNLLNDIKQKSERLTTNPYDVKCVEDHWGYWNNENNATEHQAKALENLKQGFLNLANRLENMQTLIHKTFKHSMETEALLTFNQKNFENLQEKVKSIEEIDAEITEVLENDLLEETESLMESVEANMKSLDHVNDDLVTLNEDLNNTIQECEQELNKITSNSLPKAKAHAQKLASKANIYVDLFQHSKDGAKVALDASTAHSNIANAIEAARVATNLAFEAAKNSNDELNPIGEDTIAEKGLDSKHESLDIRADALNEITRIEGKFRLTG